MSSTTHRKAVSYIDRTREFYGAQGYDRPYQWARHQDAPFAPVGKPLRESRITVITTASALQDRKPVEGVLRGAKGVWSGPADRVPERLYTDDLAWDKEATHTEDVPSFLPLPQLAEAAASGRIGSVADRFHGVPTDYSQRRTVEQDAPEVLSRCREDGVDVALLVPL